MHEVNDKHFVWVETKWGQQFHESVLLGQSEHDSYLVHSSLTRVMVHDFGVRIFVMAVLVMDTPRKTAFRAFDQAF
jgi:hypothetical protein